LPNEKKPFIFTGQRQGGVGHGFNMSVDTKDGFIKECFYKDGRRHGRSRAISNKGMLWYTNFKNDAEHGLRVTVFSNGTVRESLIENGVMKNCVSFFKNFDRSEFRVENGRENTSVVIKSNKWRWTDETKTQREEYDE
jgi:antitoxin component YwqK of YwqJK toxin-antitoxin module